MQYSDSSGTPTSSSRRAPGEMANTHVFLSTLYAEILGKTHTHKFWIESILRRMIEFFGLDQISLWRMSGNRKLMMCQYFYTRSENNYGHDLLLQQTFLPELFEQILNGSILTFHTDDEEPSTSKLARYYFGPLGIESCIWIPLAVQGSVDGMFCIESLSRTEWQSEDLVLAQQLAGILSIICSKQEQMKMKDRLIRSEKLESLGKISGGIAHDFNNVLSVIIGTSEVALDLINTTRPNMKLSAYLSEIHQAAMRGERLTRQLLSFSRQQQNQKKEMNLNKVILELKAMLDRIMGDSISIQMDLDYSIGKIIFNQSQIEQILMNLAVNSKHAMARGGVLGIRTNLVDAAALPQPIEPGKAASSYLLLEVTDTGVGIDSSELPYITEPLYSTKAEMGTGYGLSIITSIINEHRGQMNIDTKPGAGTKVSIYLPLKNMPAPDTEITDTRHGMNRTVLLIEDDIRLRKLIRNHLLSKKFNVLEASSAEEARNLVDTGMYNIALVVTDVIMPGMNGYEFAQYMLTLNPYVKILYISGTDVAINEVVILSKNSGFLQKPFTLEQMEFKVEDILAG